MLLLSMLLFPIIGIILIYTNAFNLDINSQNHTGFDVINKTTERAKIIALAVSIFNLMISLVVFMLFDFSSNQFQFVQEMHDISYFHLYLGIDGISIYFVLLTTIITPICLLSNWVSISENVKSYIIIILLLETLLLAVFMVLDILLFYIFFESILPPLFILIGLFGSSNKIRASFYLFLYTLLGSLFLLISILSIYSIMGNTDFDSLFKTNFNFSTQLFLFAGIFIAFAVKTPTMFLNTWLLKAHVESPLGGSILLAGLIIFVILAQNFAFTCKCFTNALRYIIYNFNFLIIYYERLYAKNNLIRYNTIKNTIKNTMNMTNLIIILSNAVFFRRDQSINNFHIDLFDQGIGFIYFTWKKSVIDINTKLISKDAVLPGELNINTNYMFNLPGSLFSPLSLGFKTTLFIFIFRVRASFPRMRFDQLKSFCWKALLPLALPSSNNTLFNLYTKRIKYDNKKKIKLWC